MKTKRKNAAQQNLGALIGMAVGVGVANSVAFENPAIGLGISILVFGLVFLGQTLHKRLSQ